MMKKYFKISFMIFIFLILNQSALATNDSNVNKDNIKKLKLEFLELKNVVEEVKEDQIEADHFKEIELKISEIDSTISVINDQIEEVEMLKNNLNDNENSIIEMQSWKKSVVWLIGLFSVVIYFMIRIYAEKRVDKLIDAKEKSLQRLIADDNFEMLMRQDAKLMIVSLNAEQERILKNHLKKYFKQNIDTKILKNETKTELSQLDYTKYDVIIFNDTIKNSESLFDELYNEIGNKSFYYFYFGANVSKIKQERLNRANSLVTVYPNLLDLLKFKDIEN